MIEFIPDETSPDKSTCENIGRPSRFDIPVFEIDPAWYAHIDQKLPTLRLSIPFIDENGEPRGRTPVGSYPDGPDPDGSKALRQGARYYNEAMGYTDAADRETRIQCFQAAEILYLHAAAKNNPIAYANLGYVYSYDRCEGRYFIDDCRRQNASGPRPYPREARAFECFRLAAEAGDAQACYKVGDLYRNGCGCEPDDSKAFAQYAKAYERGQADDPTVWGSAAFRLGECFELGRGCNPSFSQALMWYQRAEAGLEIAVRSGEWFYEKALANAQAGAKRMAQELDGTY